MEMINFYNKKSTEIGLNNSRLYTSSEMNNFFAEPRHAAGFHALIFYTNVFNKPHKGFIPRRT